MLALTGPQGVPLRAGWVLMQLLTATGLALAAHDTDGPPSRGSHEILNPVAPRDLPPVANRHSPDSPAPRDVTTRGAARSVGAPPRPDGAPADAVRRGWFGGDAASDPPREKRGWAVFTDPNANVDPGGGGGIGGFEGIGATEHAPPHPDLGVGPHHVVEVVNDEFRVFDKCGGKLFASGIRDYLGVEGEFFDPRVVFDPWNDRWVMLFLFRDDAAQASETVFIVSKNGVPPGAPGELGTWVYRIDAVKNPGGANASGVEACDLGFSASAVHVAGDWQRFSGSYRYAVIRTLDKAKLYNGAPVTPRDHVNITHADGSRVAPVAAEMQWTQPGAEMFFVSARAGGGTSLSLLRLDDPNGAHVLTREELDVPAYGMPGPVPQAGGAAIDSGDCRLRNCVLTANVALGGALRLYCGGTNGSGAGEPAMARLYVIDPVAGTVLETIDYAGDASQHYFQPAVGADYSGWSYWVFGRSAPGEFVSSRVAGVRETWPGVFLPGGSEVLKAGEATYAGPAVWGWAFGAQLDWGDYYHSSATRVWLVGQYARGGGDWGTRIGVASHAAGALYVQPTDAWELVGFEGGPFSPAVRVVRLSNVGETGLAWSLAAPAWVEADALGGDLYPGQDVPLTLSAGDDAAALTPGDYAGAVTILDCAAAGGGAEIPVRLRVRRRGEIVVAPDERLVAVGPEGGPFEPDSKSYDLANVGEETVDWTCTSAAPYVTVSPGSGVLAPGAHATLTVSLNGQAGMLDVGQYDTPVTIENTTNGRGSTARTVRVVVQRLAELSLTPADAFESQGQRGGPFEPPTKDYVLKNLGQQAMEFALIGSAEYVVAFPASGLLNEGQSVNVTISIGAEAASLAPGLYAENFTAQNLTTGLGNTARAVRLNVLPPPCAPCDTDCDGSVNGSDIMGFLALLEGTGVACAACAGDANGDGSVNGQDLAGFTECLTQGGVLSVTPASRFETTGPEGGPFAPDSKSYSLTNTGYSSLAWSGAETAAHMDVSPANGVLLPGQTVIMTVTNNAGIESLAPGTHDAVLTLTNDTNGRGSTSRMLRAVVQRKAEASLSPSDGFLTSGPRGGPFSPTSKTYVLTNVGEAPGDFTLSVDAEWVSVFPPYAALSGGQSVNVTVSLTSQAAGLIEGFYTGTLSVTNDTNEGLGDTSRPIELSVTPPAGGELRVWPTDGFTTSGPQGGPFSPSAKVYTLENILDGPLDWTAVSNAWWMDASPASGTLAGHATIDVTVSVNASANTLAPATYDRTLTITNATNGLGNTTRTLRTIVQRRAEAEFTPGEGMAITGPRGGPFQPESKAYVLRNAGEQSGYFTLTLDAAWVSVFPPYAELSGGQSVNVTVSLTGDALGLLEGAYDATLDVTNETTGLGNTTRPITLAVTPPTEGELSVLPTDRYAAVGPEGGPFVPPAQLYTLTNILGVPLDWSVTGAPAWIDVAPSSGTLPGNGSVVVTVGVNGAADVLPPGVHDQFITFNNDSNGLGTTTRLTRVTVKRKAELHLSPGDGFSSAGPAGGPFSPGSKTYVLTNVGESPADFAVLTDAAWVTVFPPSGLLNESQSVNVVVSINPAADLLPAGSHDATVTVLNLTSGLGDTTRGVTLTVGP